MQRDPSRRLRGTRRATIALTALAAAALTAVALVATSSATSAATAPSNTVVPALAGVAQVGQTLTASPGTWAGDTPISFSYQWQRCDSAGNNCVSIAGATAQSYTAVAADTGATLRVSVVGTNGAGAGSASSAASSPVSPAGAPTNTAAPALSGTAEQGQTLTTTQGTWTGNGPISYTYRWLRCDVNGLNCVAASAVVPVNTITLAAADLGHTIRADVIATNGAGSTVARTGPSAVVGGPLPHPSGQPTISGSAQVGAELTADKGTWSSETTSWSYQWQRCDAAGANCANVNGATGTSYGVRSADAGQTLRVVVTGSGSNGSASATSNQTPVVQALLPSSNACVGVPSGSTNVSANDLALPNRLLIDRWTFDPSLVRRTTRSLVARIHVRDSCGRSVQSAQISATAIPFEQTNVANASTGADGWATVTFTMQRGFPANPGRQQILALLVHATRQNGNVLTGISAVRTLRVNVNLHA